MGPQGPGGVSILGGGSGSANGKMDASKITYIPLFEGNQDQDEVNVLQVVPSGGTLTHFYVRLNASAANKDKGSYVFTVRKNGKPTDVSCVIGVGGKDPNGLTGFDLKNAVEFEEGDTLSIECTPKDNPNPVAMRWTARFQGVATDSKEEEN